MASQWLIADDRSQENVQKSKYEDLFVFGYGCKLFRDDEQAKLVDSGKYLIPWMGDERLMIDRYDGRGHLFDLTPYDADIRKGEQEGLSEEEKRLEAIYDEERYLELHTDLTEKSIYEEEEWKRYYESLSEGYKAVGFSYDYSGQQVPYTEPVVKQEDPEEQPFVPPQELQVPTGMKIPETNKEAAVIEKTANFIATHGLQMEIMMKTKQANNPKFMFMHFEDTLHPFYKHVIKMIKSGKFKPKVEEKVKEEEHGEEHGEGDGQHSYLHPALLQTNRASPTPEVYKPVQMPKISIHETSYGQLLKSLSKVNQEVAERMKPKEVKREIKTEPAEASGLPACMAQPVYSASMSTHNGMPPPPGIEPVTLPQSTENGDTDVKLEPGTEDSPAMDHSHLAHIVPPPPDAQPVVDRMAMYVAKNGPEFEIVVKSKKDSRFEFLLPHHIHYAYYDFKKQLFIKELEREKAENAKNKQENETEEGTEEKEDKDKSSSGAGIKFKVKVKGKEQEVVTLEKKKVFENESSEEDSENGESSERERVPKSGTSTPVADRRHKSEAKSDIDPSTAEKKIAEQRMRDRIAASAREKLGQVDKEKQLQAERKKRAAMFINMLKGSNTDGGGAQTNDKASLPEALTSQTSSRANTPASSERSSSSRQKSKSKRKHKDRRRSDSRSRSHDRSRSRSRSKSRSKKKKRKRSPTPPSAYAVVRRSPLRFPPPPPPRYQSHDRSPSNSRFSKYRSKSRSPGRSKSKKKKRSRSKSPRSKEGKVKDSKSHSKTKKKKKKRSRSKSRSPSRKSSRTKSPPSGIKKVDSQVSIQSVPSSERLPSPVTMEATESELEEGETRETTDTEDNVVKENNEQRSPSSMNDRSKHSRSRSRSRSKSRSHSRSHSRSRSRSRESVKSANGKSPLTSRHSSISRHSSRSRQRSPSIARSHSKSRSRSRSRSTSRHSSASSHHSSKDRKSRSRSKSLSPPKLSRQQSPVSPRKRTSVSPEGESGSRAAIPSTPASPDKEEDSDSCASGTSTPKPSAILAPKKNVSQYMLNRVRAIIKASREAVLKEDMPFLDDT